MAMESMRGVPGALKRRYGLRGEALYALIAGTVAVSVVALLSYLADAPFLVPSLGPTALMLFEHPMMKTAAPKHAISSHLIALAVGYLSLVAFGLASAGPVMQSGWTTGRVMATGISIGVTAALLILLRVKHPPAGATALIVTLGLITTASQFLAVIAGVVVLTALGFATSRALGVDMPVWSERSR